MEYELGKALEEIDNKLNLILQKVSPELFKKKEG